jgi:hypothetical protein
MLFSMLVLMNPITIVTILAIMVPRDNLILFSYIFTVVIYSNRRDLREI